MTGVLDPRSPVPLYAQLAEAIRYRIATGALPAGAALPPLREAAVQWGVNLHTVRHAYDVLAQQGLVRTQAPFGSVVAPDAAAPDQVDRFVHRMLRDAGRQGIGLGLLQERLTRAASAARRTGPAEDVSVVECSATQAADLAAQIQATWRVRAGPWSLELPGEPPRGLMIGTYFHYNDIRMRWPARFPQVRFVAIRPDPRLPELLRRFVRRGRRTVVTVCERDASMAANIAADLAGILPASRFRIVPAVEDVPGAALAAKPRRGSGPVLFAPRVWGQLGDAQRSDPRALEVHYVIEPQDLAQLGLERGWQARAA
jgi:DNA-binding transcriptional regulator YhcF (GntR family)